MNQLLIHVAPISFTPAHPSPSLPPHRQRAMYSQLHRSNTQLTETALAEHGSVMVFGRASTWCSEPCLLRVRTFFPWGDFARSNGWSADDS